MTIENLLFILLAGIAVFYVGIVFFSLKFYATIHPTARDDRHVLLWFIVGGPLGVLLYTSFRRLENPTSPSLTQMDILPDSLTSKRQRPKRFGMVA